MPRISNYRPEKGNDYKFIDRQISEMFQVGGTDLYLNKYIGPKNPQAGESTPSTPIYDVIKETNIQDLLLLENRDRKYDSTVYTIRGVYQVQDNDFNLSQFGIFFDNDIVYITVHINDFVKSIGRKPMSGDVVELPHLKDQFALNDADTAVPRYFVVEDVGRASEGFSVTWYPHLYRLKLKKLSDTQQYADILTQPANKDVDFEGDYDPTFTYNVGDVVRYQGELYNVVAQTTGNAPPNATYYTVYGGNSIQDILSTRATAKQINDAVIAQAEADSPLSGFETQHYYTLATDAEGNTLTVSADSAELLASNDVVDASATMEQPMRSGYQSYLQGDGIPDNGADYGFGTSFPAGATTGDFFLRTDFLPNRLFRYDGARWVKYEDNVRHTITHTNTRTTQRTSFINNTATTNTTEGPIPQRQSLSKALKPKADF